VADDIPFHAIATAFKCPSTITLEPAAPDIAVKAHHGGNIKQDEPGSALQPFSNKPRVSAINDPARPHDHRVMKVAKLVCRPGNPIGMRQVVKLIEVDRH
jgi:hypothetical protein